MKKQHFHSLDAFRFFAFLKVYFQHVPVQGHFPVFSFLKAGGGIGVAFFFTLSGFLITYLLSFEKLRFGKIRAGHFLIRRSLRIWPLFFLMVLLAALLPYQFKEQLGLHMVGGGYEFDWRYSFSFLENYKMLIEHKFPKTTPLSVFWSLCIEEHFYVTWLLVFVVIPVRHISKFLSISFCLAILARFAEPAIFNNSQIVSFDLLTNLDYFTAGGLLGYAVSNNFQKVEKFVLSIPLILRWIFVLGVFLLVLFQKQILFSGDSFLSHFNESIIALAFTILIAFFLPRNSNLKIKSKVLAYLGRISYGLYVYHIILIHLSLQFMIKQNILLDDWLTLLSFMLITFTATVAVSAFSFRFFELPFLKWREKITAR